MPLQQIAAYTSAFGRVTTALSWTVPNVQVGDVLVVISGTEGTPSPGFSAPATTGETWVQKILTNVASVSNGGIWTLTTVTSGTLAVTQNFSNSSNQSHSGVLWHFRGAAIGAVTSTTAGGSAPALNVTTTADGSIIPHAVLDWNAVAGTRTWRAGATQQLLTGTAGTDYLAGYADVVQATAGTVTLGQTAPTGQAPTILAIEILDAGNTPLPLLTTYVGAGAWDAPATVTATAPAYPTGLQENDICYAVLVVKPATATVTTPANWTLVGTSGSIAGGTAGAGTGPIQIHVFRRVVPAGGLTGTQSFTIGTSPSSVVSQIVAFRYDNSVGYTSPAWVAETKTQYSRTTASTSYGGTGAANISMGPGDAMLYVSAASDDQPTTHYSTGPTLSATGVDLYNTGTAIGSEGLNAAGNDVSGHCAYALATTTSGTSTAAPVSVHTASSAETGGSMFVRVRSQGLQPSAPPSTQFAAFGVPL